MDEIIYIAHHGIKGQKWGIRRFQYEDGTRTSAGKAREREGGVLAKNRSEFQESSKSEKIGISEETKEKIKKAAKVGAIAAAAGLAVYGASKITDPIPGIKLGMASVKARLKTDLYTYKYKHSEDYLNDDNELSGYQKGLDDINNDFRLAASKYAETAKPIGEKVSAYVNSGKASDDLKKVGSKLNDAKISAQLKIGAVSAAQNNRKAVEQAKTPRDRLNEKTVPIIRKNEAAREKMVKTSEAAREKMVRTSESSREKSIGRSGTSTKSNSKSSSNALSSSAKKYVANRTVESAAKIAAAVAVKKAYDSKLEYNKEKNSKGQKRGR